MSVVEETSVNNKVLRSRNVAIDETDPNLRVKIVEGVWPKKKVTETKQSETEIQPETETEMAESAETFSADENFELLSKIQKQHDEEIRRVKWVMQEKLDYEMRLKQREQAQLRDALVDAQRELKEREEIISGMADADSQRIHLPSYRLNCDVDEAFQRLQVSMKNGSDEPTVSAVANPAVIEPSKVRSTLSSVSDRLIAPTPFTGRSNVDAESWLEVFERYCAHRNLSAEDKVSLFPLMLREAACDWVSTLAPDAFESYNSLIDAFKRNYFNLSELSWQLKGNLWRESQKCDEKVDEFVQRIRKNARRVNLTADAIGDIILNGLKPSIRMHVLLQGGAGKPPHLEDLIKQAKLAEAVVVTNSDNSSSLLIEVMKATAATNELQARELKELSNRVAALAETHSDVHAVSNEIRRGENPSQRVYKNTPQQQQRNNWARTAGRTEVNEARNDQPMHNQQRGEPCGFCGRKEGHAPQQKCPARAEGVVCFRCSKRGHYGRACRSGRNLQNPSSQ